jgi:hypothetical protein
MFDERHNFSWTFTGVYGPQGELEKKMFIRELKNLKQTTLPSWLIFEDFNLIYKEDKNNGRLNRRLMLRFRRDLNHMGVKEIYLSRRKYTWTNSQQTPTMLRIDRAFCTPSVGAIISGSHSATDVILSFRSLPLIPSTPEYTLY